MLPEVEQACNLIVSAAGQPPLHSPVRWPETVATMVMLPPVGPSPRTRLVPLIAVAV